MERVNLSVKLPDQQQLTVNLLDIPLRYFQRFLNHLIIERVSLSVKSAILNQLTVKLLHMAFSYFQ